LGNVSKFRVPLGSQEKCKWEKPGEGSRRWSDGVSERRLQAVKELKTEGTVAGGNTGKVTEDINRKQNAFVGGKGRCKAIMEGTPTTGEETKLKRGSNTDHTRRRTGDNFCGPVRLCTNELREFPPHWGKVPKPEVISSHVAMLVGKTGRTERKQKPKTKKKTKTNTQLSGVKGAILASSQGTEKTDGCQLSLIRNYGQAVRPRVKVEGREKKSAVGFSKKCGGGWVVGET